ncbi:predicted protein [Micromonas commoda]|uniref:Uncharacterized protein n=1 Tax=Micromonas commoda (strain RCC299 / NOUM17 / CCMP2709) TaxID=296587 RepID=C1EE40_MICCC|nr:predicted protein [Micromonas commoda]ACO66167.1 predicted protein [Micromonas commoda]|eukprot:XP_002504909.1 predicted protein [Micromonas commoda]
MAAAAHPQEPWNKAQFDKDNRIPAAQYELLNSLPGWGNLSTAIPLDETPDASPSNSEQAPAAKGVARPSQQLASQGDWLQKQKGPALEDSGSDDDDDEDEDEEFKVVYAGVKPDPQTRGLAAIATATPPAATDDDDERDAPARTRVVSPRRPADVKYSEQIRSIHHQLRADVRELAAPRALAAGRPTPVVEDIAPTQLAPEDATDDDGRDGRQPPRGAAGAAEALAAAGGVFSPRRTRSRWRKVQQAGRNGASDERVDGTAGDVPARAAAPGVGLVGRVLRSISGAANAVMGATAGTPAATKANGSGDDDADVVRFPGFATAHRARHREALAQPRWDELGVLAAEAAAQLEVVATTQPEEEATQATRLAATEPAAKRYLHDELPGAKQLRRRVRQATINEAVGQAASDALAAAVAAATEHGGAGVGSPLRRRASMFGAQDADRAEHDLTLEARERVEARRSAAAAPAVGATPPVEERREGAVGKSGEKFPGKVEARTPAPAPAFNPVIRGWLSADPRFSGANGKRRRLESATAKSEAATTGRKKAKGPRGRAALVDEEDDGGARGKTGGGKTGGGGGETPDPSVDFMRARLSPVVHRAVNEIERENVKAASPASPAKRTTVRKSTLAVLAGTRGVISPPRTGGGEGGATARRSLMSWIGLESQ